MADQFAIVEVTIPAGATSADFTDPSITEAFSAALFFWQSGTSDGNDNSHLLHGVGCCVENSGQSGDVDRSVVAHGSNATLNSPDYNTNASFSDGGSTCIRVVDPTNPGGDTLTFQASKDTAISGGVRLAVAQADIDLKVICVLFAGLTEASCGTAGGALGSSSEVVGAAPGTRPDALLIFGAKGGAVTTFTQDATIGFGAVVDDGSDSQAYGHMRLRDATEPSEATGRVDTTHGAACFNRTQTTSTKVAFSFNANGFAYTVAGPAASACAFAYLALRFSGPFRVGVITAAISGSTGEQTFSGFSFRPRLVLGFSSLLTSTDTDTTSSLAGASGYFIAGPDYERAHTVHGEVGLSGTSISFNCENRSEDVALLTFDHQGNIAQRATWAGSAPGGFVLDFTTATVGHMVAFGLQLGAESIRPERGRGLVRRALDGGRRRLALVTGVVRASSARALQAFARNRRRAFDSLRPPPERLPTAPVVERTLIDPVLRGGDNSSAGSSKGSDAGSGSNLGDTA